MGGSLGENVDELVFGILLHAILFFPLIGEENHRVVLFVLNEEASGGFLKRFHVAENPGAALVGKGSENSFYSIFVF